MFDNVIIGVDGAEGGWDVLWFAQQLASLDAQLTLVYVQVVAPRPGLTSGALSLADEALCAME